VLREAFRERHIGCRRLRLGIRFYTSADGGQRDPKPVTNRLVKKREIFGDPRFAFAQQETVLMEHRQETADGGRLAHEIAVVSLGCSWDPSLPIAASRAEALGLLDLTWLGGAQVAGEAAARLKQLGRGRIGLVLHGSLGDVELAALEAVRACDTILLSSEPDVDLAPALERCRGVAQRVGLVVRSLPEAEAAGELGFDLVVAKGFESGGLVGEQTSFILAQQLLDWGRLPTLVWGGIGPDTAAACCVAGAAGVVVDWQLALVRESPLPARAYQELQQFDGSQTVTYPAPGGRWFRCLVNSRGGDNGLSFEGLSKETAVEDFARFRESLRKAFSAQSSANRMWPVGQDAAVALCWSSRHRSVARCLTHMRDTMAVAINDAVRSSVFAPQSPWANEHGTRLPVAQGPMTRVTDSPDFARLVAEAGGLPFLALGTMHGEQAQKLLSRAEEVLSGKPWGVALLSFVDATIREEQMRVLRQLRPPVALLGAGTSEEAAELEQLGTKAYLYAASPTILKTFLEQGVRRFVLEGCECGGYVGPRSSFSLWQQLIDTLLNPERPDAVLEEIDLILAGGIHDRRSSQMVATLAARVAERGVRVGLLAGTAYLFTDEIVESGAITRGFQEEALQAEQTLRLDMGGDRAIRCAPTPFSSQWAASNGADESRDEAGLTAEQICLEHLRTASRGVARQSNPTGDESPFVAVDDRQQRRDGLFVMGQSAALESRRTSLKSLHDQLCPTDGSKVSHLTSPVFATVERLPPAPPPLDIAVIGMACLLPGADEIGSYWENILDKRDVIEEIPRDRFHVDRWFDSDRSARDKVYSKWGGFLDDLPFDPLRYGIPPLTLKSIEPMQLLALMLVDQALGDAGYDDNDRHRERTSVIFGAGGGSAELGANYAFRAMLPQYVENPDESLWRQLPEWTEDSFAGILLNVVSGRVSNRFDFGGTNFTVDAACASSLAAVYLACQELVNGTADMAITGGCDTVQNPISYLCFGKSGALSPTGRSRPFDESADGIAISEGLAAVVLKRREDAERDGDRIYALLRAVAGGSDGRSKGMTAPRPEGQKRTFERAYAQARFSPATVGLFEAHGTGTAVGDATECGSLTSLLSEAGAPARSCAIGSVKSMMGHTKCTAGVAGLIKTALALHHRTLPPTMHVEKPNAKAGLTDGPLYPNVESRPWIRGEHPRRAAVSSFGFGGTNFHAVLEEYADDPLPSIRNGLRRRRPVELFFFEGSSAAVLGTRVKSLLEPLSAAIRSQTDVDLADLAFTWFQRQAERGATHRAAVVAKDARDLAEKLEALLTGIARSNDGDRALPNGVYYSPTPLTRETPLAVLFPGQGSQYVNMLRELAIEFGEVSEAFEAADARLRRSLDHPLSRYVFPPPSFDEVAARQASSELKSTDILQPALGAASIGLWRLLENFGISAGMLAGHSYGELVALCVAGCLSAESLYRLSWARGKAIVDMAESGGDGDLGQMVAVRAGEAEVAAALEDCPEVWLANMNSPRQTIISGTREGIERAVRVLDHHRLANTPLKVSCGFHSPLMKPASRRFREVLNKTTFQQPTISVYSNRTGEVYPTDARQIRQELTEHLVDRVQFAAEIEAMYAAGARVFLEVGPGNVLSRLTDDILGQRPHRAIATCVSRRHDLEQFAEAISQLYVEGVPLDPARWFDRPQLGMLDLETMQRIDAQPVPRHAWLVNGGYARPAGQPPRDPVPQARLASEVDSEKRSVTAGSEKQSAATSPPKPSAKTKSGGAQESSGAVNRLTQTTANSTPSPSQVSARQREAASARPNGAASARTEPAIAEDRPAASSTSPDGRPKSPAPAAAQYNIHSSNHGPQRSPMAESEKRQPAITTNVAGQVPAARSAVDAEAFAMFQETMRRFLDVQETAIAAFFGGQPSIANDPSPSTKSMPTSVPYSPSIEQPAPQPAAADAEPPTQQAPAEAQQPTTTASAPPASPATSAEPQPQPAAPQPEPTPRAEPVAATEPSTPAAEAIDDKALTERLVELVSQRTGYPAEMLDLDANLEADLGIDSIKRVEIIGAFRRDALPEFEDPPEWFMERMGAAGTLKQILDGVLELAGTTSNSGSGSSAAANAEPASAAAKEAIAAENVAATNVQPQELHQSLVDIVSQRTGYPAEMLDLDANLEADLGIDSIKRVEVIGAFRREALPACEEPPEWFVDQMTAAGTLRAILEGVQQLATENGHSNGNGKAEDANHSQPAAEGRPVNPNSASDGPRAAHSTHDANAPIDCPRCVACAVESPHESTPDPLPEGVFLLTNDRGGLAQQMADHLASLGRSCVVIDTAALTSEAVVLEKVSQLRAEHGALGGLLHLLPLSDAPAMGDLDRRQFGEFWSSEVRGMLFLLKALTPELKAADQKSFWVLAASSGGASIGRQFDVDATRPWRGGLAGIFKTAAKEWTAARFRLVDIDRTPQPDELLAEISHSSIDVEVGYREGHRFVVRPLRLETAGQPTDSSAGVEPFTAQDVFLLTGGARGITAEIAHELASQTSATMVLLGRTPPPDPAEDPRLMSTSDPRELSPLVVTIAKQRGETLTAPELRRRVRQLIGQQEIRQTLDRIRATGAQAEYFACDIRDADRLTDVVREAETRLGAITGIIHGAGVIEDRYIVDKTTESFDRVVGTKLDPLLTLLDLLDVDRLKALMLFSSVAGFFGNAGQVDYAAANETLNRFAARLARQCPQTRVTAINWGPWEGLGMVTPEVARQFAERGVGMVRPSEGRRAAVRELLDPSLNDPVVLYGPGPWLEEADRLNERLAAQQREDSETASSAPATALPLLARTTPKRNKDGSLEVELPLDPQQDLFLKDHCIDGKPVLPAAVALELIAEIATLAAGGEQVCQVEDLRLFKGVVVDEDDRALRVEATPIDAEAASNVRKWQVRIFDATPPRRPLYAAVVSTTVESPPAPAAPAIHRIGTSSPVSAQQAYDEWLFHGPLFHTIHEITGSDPSGMDALVCAGDENEAEAAAGWIIDPSVLDAAPQMALLWSRAIHGTSMLPNRMGLYRRYGSLGDGPMELLLRADPETDPSNFRGDAWFIQNGRVVGFLGGLECAGTAALNRIGGSRRP